MEGRRWGQSSSALRGSCGVYCGSRRRKLELVRHWRVDRVWARSALRPAARLGTPASFLCDEMPIGLEEGIVMIMLRNAGSLKNDKKFNMREIVIDTETTGLDLLRLKQSTRQEHQTNEFLPASHGDQSDGSSSDRREQYEQMGVLGDQRRKSVEDGASASHGVRAEHLERKIVEGARDPIFDSHAPSGPRIKLAAKSETPRVEASRHLRRTACGSVVRSQ